MVIVGLLRNPDDAMEVAQESFFRAYRKITSFQGQSSFYTWLYRIAVNICIDHQRRQKRSPLEFRESMDEVFEQQNEVAKDPFSDVHDRELREQMLSAIDDLTPEHKAVIVLRTLEGMSYKDIGSTVTAEMGLMALEINGTQTEVDKAVAWLKEKGVTVESIEKNVAE